jgi:2,5-diketo-D-gluconate reductase A
MPLVGLGTWALTGKKGYEAIRYGLEVGYRHIDTATMYRNEAEVGQAVRDSGVSRADVFVTTKLPPERAGRERETLTASLRALGMEHVDLWLVHWPPRRPAMVSTWQEFLAAQRDGLARAVGVSNFSTPQIDDLVKETGETPAVNQIPWSPWEHHPGRLAESAARGVVVEAEIAASHNVTPAQVVLRWHLEHDIVVIPKSARPERLKSNLDIFGFTLTADEITRIDALSGSARRR